MKISFLVTYYNQEQYVKQSMDSILAVEKPSEWEILIGDDGSSDKTVEVVNEYVNRDPEHIRLYIMQREKNAQYNSVKRASANRINLLEHCTGECFCLLDGDDFYYDTSFATEAINVFEKNNDISVVSFGFCFFRDGHFEKEVLLTTGEAQYVDTKRYIRNLYLPAGACVHKIVWGKDRIEYIKKIGFFDDNDIVINSLNYGRMYYINRPIYAYRQNIMSTYSSMNEAERAVLNVQGMDVDIKLIDCKYTNDIVFRNSESILIMYLLRNKMKNMLGDEKYERYNRSSNMIDNSLCFYLLNYKIINDEEKRVLKSILYRILFAKRRNLKIIAKYYLGAL